MKKIDFEFDTIYGLFKDSLVFMNDDIPDELTIENLKQYRLDKWIELITTPDIVTENLEEIIVE